MPAVSKLTPKHASSPVPRVGLQGATPPALPHCAGANPPPACAPGPARPEENFLILPLQQAPVSPPIFSILLVPAGRIPGIYSLPLSSRGSLSPRPLTSADLALSPTAPPPGPVRAAAFTTTRTAACARPGGGNPCRRLREGARALVGVARAEKVGGRALREDFRVLHPPGLAAVCLQPRNSSLVARLGGLGFLLAFMIQGFTFPPRHCRPSAFLPVSPQTPTKQG